MNKIMSVNLDKVTERLANAFSMKYPNPHECWREPTEIYQMMDDALGRQIEACGDDCLVS